jgi:hypothetical protein
LFEDDPVSTYTLGAAANDVLRDIAKAQGITLDTFRNLAMERVVPGKEMELNVALRRHHNNF